MIRSGTVVSAKEAADSAASAIKSADIPAHDVQSIQVKLDPMSGCGACSASSGCGVQILPVASAPLFVECQLPIGRAISVGDRVQVQLNEPDKGWLIIVLRAYGGPTVGMITGSLVGFWSAQALHMPQFTESFSLVGFVVGLAGGLIAWCRAEKSVQMRYTSETHAQIYGVIQER